MRGAVVPYVEYAPQFQIDDDDSSSDLGIIFKRFPLDANPTVLVSPTVITQSAVAMSSPYAVNPTFGRPAVMQLELLSVQQVVLPKEGVSILQLTNPALKALEYVRVISVNSNVVQVIRNYYPEYAVYDSTGNLPATWPKGTTVRVCISTGYPEPSVYDPDWAVTKATMFRFFELMGYSRSDIAPYLKPKYSGDRTLFNASIPLSPIGGYANVTTAWPVEFNSPSTIIANTHTWQYVGYFDYSRGLPKYQVNQIPKKLTYDYLSTTSWGGRLTVMGADESGQLVFLGPIREALTGQYYITESPLSNAANRQVYTTPEPTPVFCMSPWGFFLSSSWVCTRTTEGAISCAARAAREGSSWVFRVCSTAALMSSWVSRWGAPTCRVRAQVSVAVSTAHSSKAAQSGRRCKRCVIGLALREAVCAGWLSSAFAAAASILSAPCAEGFRL
jgi:hypothetical protein